MNMEEQELNDLTSVVRQYKKISRLNVLSINKFQNNKSMINSGIWKEFNRDVDKLISKMEKDLKVEPV